MTEFKPGDRVLVTADCLPEGGMLGTWLAEDRVNLDGTCNAGCAIMMFGPGHERMTLDLHHRPRPPRPPDPEPFTRSDGAIVEWSWTYLTAEDAHRYAAGYERIAAILEWEAAIATQLEQPAGK